jgi:hypothetical protein
MLLFVVAVLRGGGRFVCSSCRCYSSFFSFALNLPIVVTHRDPNIV